jgi:hypothetical protein
LPDVANSFSEKMLFSDKYYIFQYVNKVALLLLIFRYSEEEKYRKWL